MKILWTHNFDPSVPEAGVFMHKAAEGLRDLGIDIRLEYLGNLRSPIRILKAREHVRSVARKYDLVHAQYGSACAFVTSVVDHCPKIVTLRGNDWNLYSLTCGFHFWHTRLARFMTRFSIDKFDCVVTVSKRMAADLRREFPNQRYFVIPAPIDLKSFVPVNKTRRNREKVVLFTAHSLTDPVKRFDLAKEAIRIANAKLGNVELRIANGIPHKDIPKFVAACDLVLCTSETEGWPNSIKEALACNIPFVSTDVSDLGEIARTEPSCRICPPDAKIIAENICEALALAQVSDLRKYVSHMRIEESSKMMLDVYESVLDRDRKMKCAE